MTLRARIDAQIERWRFRYVPKLIDGLVGLSTWPARAKLNQTGPISILVDNNVLGHGVTHTTGWISTGKSKWGGVHEINTGYAARIPVHADDNKTETYRNICFLPGIIDLARRGLMQLKTSAELRAEQFHQPGGRFCRGPGRFDYSLFAGVDLDPVDGFVFPEIGPDYLGLPNSRNQQFQRIDSAGDPLYQALKQELGDKNSLDAWHIRTAETHGLDFFLTMDFKLLRTIAGRKKREPFVSLRTQIVTPVDLGMRYDLIPIPPRLFSYHGASFFVRADLSWGDRPRRQARRSSEGGLIR